MQFAVPLAGGIVELNVFQRWLILFDADRMTT